MGAFVRPSRLLTSIRLRQEERSRHLSDRHGSSTTDGPPSRGHCHLTSRDRPAPSSVGLSPHPATDSGHPFLNSGPAEMTSKMASPDHRSSSDLVRFSRHRGPAQQVPMSNATYIPCIILCIRRKPGSLSLVVRDYNDRESQTMSMLDHRASQPLTTRSHMITMKL